MITSLNFYCSDTQITFFTDKYLKSPNILVRKLYGDEVVEGKTCTNFLFI